MEGVKKNFNLINNTRQEACPCPRCAVRGLYSDWTAFIDAEKVDQKVIFLFQANQKDARNEGTGTPCLINVHMNMKGITRTRLVHER